MHQLLMGATRLLHRRQQTPPHLGESHIPTQSAAAADQAKKWMQKNQLSLPPSKSIRRAQSPSLISILTKRRSRRMEIADQAGKQRPG
jgi:hypothetical protein